MRRVLIISGGVIVFFILLGFFLFFFVPSSQESGGGPAREGVFGSLFPFNFGGGANITEEPSDDVPIVSEGGAAPRLRKITANPAVGGIFFENGEDTGILYIERATGHVFEGSTENTTVKRISNTTIPEIQEVVWVNKDQFIIRYLTDEEAIETFSVRLASTSEEQALQGTFITSWDRGVLDPEGRTLFTVTEVAGDASLALVNPDGSNKRSLFTSPISSWVPLQSRNGLFVYSAPASGIPGGLFRVVGTAISSVLGNQPGLIAQVSPGGDRVLFSTGEGNAVSLFMMKTDSGEIFESPISTIADKCVFLGDGVRVVCGVPEEFPEGEYPNDWLLGRVAFSDYLWLVDFELGSATLLSIPEDEANEIIDVLKPFVDPRDEYVGFVNKNDLSLWSLRISEEPIAPEASE